MESWQLDASNQQRMGWSARSKPNLAIAELMVVLPKMTSRIKKPDQFVPLFSRGLRAMLSWFRDYARGLYKRQILKNTSSSDQAFIDSIASQLVLINYEEWVVMKKKVHGVRRQEGKGESTQSICTNQNVSFLGRSSSQKFFL